MFADSSKSPETPDIIDFSVFVRWCSLFVKIGILPNWRTREPPRTLEFIVFHFLFGEFRTSSPEPMDSSESDHLLIQHHCDRSLGVSYGIASNAFVRTNAPEPHSGIHSGG